MDELDKQWKQYMDIRDGQGIEKGLAFAAAYFVPGSRNAEAIRSGYFPTPEEQEANRRMWTHAAKFLNEGR